MSALYDLTDDEAVLLDGKVSDKAQAKINAAKLRIAQRSPDVPPAVSDFVADMLAAASEHGRLAFRRTSLDHCRICGGRATYAKFKSGPRRGEDNYAKKIRLGGIDLDPSFVTIQGHARIGCCSKCWDSVKPAVLDALNGVEVELPEAMRPDGWPAYKRHANRRCKCGWEGHEGQMVWERTIVGDGTFPSRCPECNFGCGWGQTLEVADGFVVVTR